MEGRVPGGRLREAGMEGRVPGGRLREAGMEGRVPGGTRGTGGRPITGRLHTTLTTLLYMIKHRLSPAHSFSFKRIRWENIKGTEFDGGVSSVVFAPQRPTQCSPATILLYAWFSISDRPAAEQKNVYRKAMYIFSHRLMSFRVDGCSVGLLKSKNCAGFLSIWTLNSAKPPRSFPRVDRDPHVRMGVLVLTSYRLPSIFLS